MQKVYIGVNVSHMYKADVKVAMYKWQVFRCSRWFFR